MRKPKPTAAFIANPKQNNYQKAVKKTKVFYSLFCCLNIEKYVVLCYYLHNIVYRKCSFMIKHIVCFKLKDNSLAECEKARDVLMSMKGNVPQLRDIAVGIDFLHSERSYDLILEVVLDDEAALESYQNDPYHCSVVKTHMHAVRESSVAVDYVI